MISYEVSLGLIIMPILLFSGTANISGIILSQDIYFFLYHCDLHLYYFLLVF